jgi:chemotaxis protein histidine kinase CheA
MAIDHSKFLARFVDEAREHCAKITEGLLSLEASPGSPDTVDAVFRSAHTIKGSARMMKLAGIGELAHGMEDVLDAARSGRIGFTREVSDLLFQGLDALAALLDRVASGDQPEAPPALVDALRRAATAEAAAGLAEPAWPSEPAERAERARQTPPTAADADAAATGQAHPGGKPAGAPGQAEYIRVNAAKLDDLIRLMGEVISEHGLFRKDLQQLREFERAMRRHLDVVSQLLPKQDGDAPERGRLLGRGDALRQAMRLRLAAISESVMLQEHLIAELQDASLTLRMLPLATVFDPLRRTVRDLAREFGKDIDFVIRGGQTELDRKIAERIGDSLMHMIRNALDHGIESAAERAQAGKPPRGTITLAAYHDNGGVSIELSDDGRGLDTEKIREKALAKRLHDAETLARMSRAEINNLIFAPGFSTSPIITDISGRGVGMDVVRKNIVDELKGTVTIETREGSGSTFLLRLPLNLAVFPLFFLSAAGTVCALPVTFVVELLRVDAGDIIEIVDKRAIRLREQIVPVEELARVLRLPGQAAASSKEALIVVVRDGRSLLGLQVDEILGGEDMVVKPLPRHLRKLRLVIGGTIGEGGRIVNVLHVPELLRLAREQTGAGRTAEAPVAERGAAILVVDDSVNTREIEKSILEAYGYEVDMAEDGQEALEKTSGRRFDLVITDVEMPRLDGFSLTERLRADQNYRNVPIIIVTSREKEEDKKRGILVGADAYIVKQAFDQSNLLDTVRSLIG